jgi:hypothetical protein
MEAEGKDGIEQNRCVVSLEYLHPIFLSTFYNSDFCYRPKLGEH